MPGVTRSSYTTAAPCWSSKPAPNGAPRAPPPVVWGRGSVDGEAVADAGNAVNVPRPLRVHLNLLAQPVNVRVHCAGLDFHVVSPDLAQQVTAAEHLPRPGAEQGQNIELSDGELHLGIVAPHLAPRDIDNQTWKFAPRLRRL